MDTEGTTIPRAKQEEIKPKADRSGEMSETSKLEPDFGVLSNQKLTNDALSVIAKFSKISDAAAMSKVSKTLNEISRSDIETLKEYRKNHQLGFQEDLGLSIILLAAQNPSKPAVGDITNLAEIDPNLTPEEALNRLQTTKDNYEQVQQAFNDLLNSFSIFAPDVKNYLKAVATMVGIEVVSLLLLGAYFLPEHKLINVYGGYSGFILEMLLETPGLSKWPAILFAPPLMLSIYQTGRVALFRTAATGILDDLKKQLSLK